MTTYVEKSDSAVTVSMVLLIIAIIAIVGFGIWYFGGYSSAPTIIHDTTTVPAPQPPAQPNVLVQPSPVLPSTNAPGSQSSSTTTSTTTTAPGNSGGSTSAPSTVAPNGTGSGTSQ